MDSRCSPKHVHPTNGSDQVTSFFRDSRSSCLAVADLLGPVPAKSFPMPTQNRFWFDNDQGGTPAGPKSESQTHSHRSAGRRTSRLVFWVRCKTIT